MFGKLIKTRSHYVYDYKPRYYDARKEKLASLEREYLSSDKKAVKIAFEKDYILHQWKTRMIKSVNKGVRRRMLFIIFVLVSIIAYLFGFHKIF